MSKFLVSEISPTIGRGLIASQTILLGETIFDEQPLLLSQFSWNKLYGYSACDFCLRPLETVSQNIKRLLSASGNTSQFNETLLPDANCCYSIANPSPTTNIPVSCDKCHKETYCSDLCRQSAWKSYHSLLCSLVDENNSQTENPLKVLDEYWRSIHFPPETSTILLPLKILAMIACAEPNIDRPQLLNQLNNFCHNFYSPSNNGDVNGLPLKLIGREFLSHIEQLRLLCESAINHQLEMQLKMGSDPQYVSSAHDCLAKWLTPDGFKSLLSLVARNAQGIATSPLAMWVKTMRRNFANTNDKEKLKEFNKYLNDLYEALEQSVGIAFLDNEGSGLYSLQSLLNHSCSPNAQICFDGSSSHLKVIALKNINPGEEISIDYIRSRQSPEDELYGDQEEEEPSSSAICDEEECLSRSRRQKMLREYYLFHCQCSLCLSQADQPSDNESSDDDEDAASADGENMDM